MSMNFLFPVCGLFIVGYYFLDVYKCRAVISRQRSQGLKDVVALRSVLELLPQHRGMTNALLQGDESFRAKLKSLQGQVDNKLMPVVEMVSSGDRWVVAQRVACIQDNWSMIKRDLNGFSAPESFAKHTALVTEILYLINDVADAAGMFTVSNSEARLADVVINQLPMMTESLGQARGMGAGVAARGQCGIDMKVKLRFLLEKTNKVASDVGRSMEASLGINGDLNTRTANELAESQQATEYFLSLLDTRIINARSVEIASAEYYDAGTDAIKRSFILLDSIYESMRKTMGDALDRSSKQLWIARAVAISLIVPAGFLFSRLL